MRGGLSGLCIEEARERKWGGQEGGGGSSHGLLRRGGGLALNNNLDGARGVTVG
jgi:hypothetical protein